MTENNKIVQENSLYIDEDKNTTLHYEAAHGNLENVTKEITNGCKVDPLNFLGWTPLMMATRNGHFEVVEYLIEKRANSTSENYFGYNILLMAVASGDLKVLHIILQHLLCGGVSRRSLQKLFSPISLAVLFGYQHVVEYLVQRNFCVNAISAKTDWTPLMFSNTMRNADLSRFLISRGAKCAGTQEPLKSEHRKSNATCKQPLPELSPLILVTQSPASPMNPSIEIARRSSDLNTPYFTPHISPLPPGPFVQQVFFPPNFSPSQFMAPVNSFPLVGSSNDFLNVRILQANYSYYSPVTPVYVPTFNLV